MGKGREIERESLIDWLRENDLREFVQFNRLSCRHFADEFQCLQKLGKLVDRIVEAAVFC